MNKSYGGELAYLLREEIKKEFEIAHLSGNLADTVIIQQTTKGWRVEIPANKYDIGLYEKTGEIRYTEGSYADEVDYSGGFSGLHVGYVERCIENAIRRCFSGTKIKISG